MYHITYGFLYLMSLLPLRALYMLSDAVYALVYYVIGYRRKVVMSNLEIAFPEKSLAEKEKIARKFYHNLIDTFVETIKMLSANDQFFLKRVTGNFEILNELHKTGKSCHVLLGHTFNWEWANHSISLNIAYRLLIVYMPIKNKVMNRIFLKLRTRGKSVMLSAHHMRTEMMPYRNSQYLLGLAADQNPGSPKNAYWLRFFNRPAPFVTGPEKGARARNIPVLFCYIEKKKRGYYNMVLSMEEENPAECPEGSLTVRYVRYLENVIRLYPDMYLWSHRRWKHTWKDEYAPLWIE